MKKPCFNSYAFIARNTSSVQRRALFPITLMGLGLIAMSISGLWKYCSLAFLGPLPLGVGLALVGGSGIFSCYLRLTPKAGFWALVISRCGGLLLGPGAALFLRPWQEVQSGIITMGQCIGVCLLFSSLSVIPCGISLFRLFLTRHEETAED